jgi:hypothetical protein
MSKKIIITGATGLIGTKLSERLISKGDEIIVFTRSISKARELIPKASAYVNWDYNDINSFQKYLEGIDAVIHLAGANLAAERWTSNYKKIIYKSRIKSTNALVEAIKIGATKPEVFICASAVGYYGNKGDEIINENSPMGNDFLALLCCDWENAANPVKRHNIRLVQIRTGVVLSKDEGMLGKMITPFKYFIGGPLGSGKQWVPWISLDDMISIYTFVLENEIEGAVNAASPIPVRMTEFAKLLGKKLNRPSYLKAPKFGIKLVVGEIADSILFSQRVIPQKIISAGYKFKFEKLESAFDDLFV